MSNTYIHLQVIKTEIMVLKKINGGHQKIKERMNGQGRPFSGTDAYAFKSRAEFVRVSQTRKKGKRQNRFCKGRKEFGVLAELKEGALWLERGEVGKEIWGKRRVMVEECQQKGVMGRLLPTLDLVSQRNPRFIFPEMGSLGASIKSCAPSHTVINSSCYVRMDWKGIMGESREIDWGLRRYPR